MNTQLFIQIVLIALAITFNSDLKIYFKKAVSLVNAFYDNFSKFLFGNQSNICRP